MDTALILNLLNIIISIMAIPPSLFLLKVILVEGKNPLKALKNFHPMNILLRVCFTLMPVIAIINALLAILRMLDAAIPRHYYASRDLLVDILISFSTWFLYYIYKKI